MRELDPDRSKWSKDDKAWAAQRPEQYPDLAPETGPDPSTVTLAQAAGVGGTPDDDYQTWSVAELAKEGKNRQGLVAPTGDDAKKKTPWIDALRYWDQQHPAV
jgi:hypothetical protein